MSLKSFGLETDVHLYVCVHMFNHKAETLS